MKQASAYLYSCVVSELREKRLERVYANAPVHIDNCKRMILQFSGPSVSRNTKVSSVCSCPCLQVRLHIHAQAEIVTLWPSFDMLIHLYIADRPLFPSPCRTNHDQSRPDSYAYLYAQVGTVGTVKAVHQKALYEDIRAEIILSNA